MSPRPGLRRELIVALLLAAAVPSPAAKPAASTWSAACDPRLELLGVVQHLARDGELEPEIEARFKAFRAHPAVAAYREIHRRDSPQPYGLIVLALGHPPELRWRRDPAILSGSFLSLAGGRESMDKFLADLRDFARASRFMEFYREQAPACRRLADSTFKPHKGRDYLGMLESYAGRPLDCRLHVLISPRYDPGRLNSYILPYPYGGPGRLVPGPYDVYSIIGPEDHADAPVADDLWQEVVYIVVEAGFIGSEERIMRLGALHEPLRPECPAGAWDACARSLLAAAILERLYSTALAAPPGKRDSPFGKYRGLLSDALAEYEARRADYPTLLDFFPRLVEVLEALESEVNRSPPERAPARRK